MTSSSSLSAYNSYSLLKIKVSGSCISKDDICPKFLVNFSLNFSFIVESSLDISGLSHNTTCLANSLSPDINLHYMYALSLKSGLLASSVDICNNLLSRFKPLSVFN